MDKVQNKLQNLQNRVAVNALGSLYGGFIFELLNLQDTYIRLTRDELGGLDGDYPQKEEAFIAVSKRKHSSQSRYTAITPEQGNMGQAGKLVKRVEFFYSIA